MKPNRTCESSSLLQCRGPERRATIWHLLVAALIVSGFVGVANLVAASSPPTSVTQKR